MFEDDSEFIEVHAVYYGKISRASIRKKDIDYFREIEDDVANSLISLRHWPDSVDVTESYKEIKRILDGKDED